MLNGFLNLTVGGSTLSVKTTNNRLLALGDITFLGAFKLPFGTFGFSECSYGGLGMAYNPANDSLFITGHVNDGGSVAEIDIPSISSGAFNTLSTATVLQNFVNVVAKLPSYTLEGNVRIGGLQIIGSELHGTMYEFYDGDTDAAVSHFKLSSLTLASATGGGLYALDYEAGSVAGWVTPITPINWKKNLGKPYYSGQGGLSIITRTSAGLAAVGYDPAQLGGAPAPVSVYIHYPATTHPLGKLTGNPEPFFNGGTQPRGSIFPDGGDSVLFFGTHGEGAAFYGLGTNNAALHQVPEPEGSVYIYDPPLNNVKGYHAYPYAYYCWAYDANDLLKVKQGTKQNWEIIPYGAWSLNSLLPHPMRDEGGSAMPPDGDSRNMMGVAWDAGNRRAFIAQFKGDGGGLPLINVLQIGLP